MKKKIDFKKEIKLQKDNSKNISKTLYEKYGKSNKDSKGFSTPLDVNIINSFLNAINKKNIPLNSETIKVLELWISHSRRYKVKHLFKQAHSFVEKQYGIEKIPFTAPKHKNRFKKDVVKKIKFGTLDIEVTKIEGIEIPKNKYGVLTPKVINDFLKANPNIRVNHVYSFAKVEHNEEYFVEFSKDKDDKDLLYRELQKLNGIYYGANTSRYENHFIVHSLLYNGYKETLNSKKPLVDKTYRFLIDDSNSILGLAFSTESGNIVEIRDILRLTSNSLDGTIKAFVSDKSFHKKEVDKSWYRQQRFSKEDCNEEDLEYIANDVVGLYKAIAEFERLSIATFGVNVLHYLTIGSFTKAVEEINFQKDIPSYASFFETQEIDRQFFSGGYTSFNPKNAYKNIKVAISYDVMSMYPGIMMKAYLPYGKGSTERMSWKEFKEIRKPINKYYHNVKVLSGTYIYNGEYPTAQNKDKMYVSILECTEDNPLYFQGFDVLDNVHILNNSAIVEVTTHKTIRGFFHKTYLDFITAKEYYKSEDKGKSYVFKIMANAGYGKIGENTTRDKYSLVDGLIELDGIEEHKRKWFHSTVMAGAITAIGRYVLSRMNEELGEHFVIGDTDSVKISLDKITKKEVENIINETFKKYNLPIGFISEKITTEEKKGKTFDEVKPIVAERVGGFQFEYEMYNLVAFQKKTYCYHKSPDLNSESFEYTMAGVSEGDLNILNSKDLLKCMKKGLIIQREKTTVAYNNGVYFYKAVLSKGRTSRDNITINLEAS